MTRTKIALLPLLALAIGACGDDDVDDPGSRADALAGRTFLSESVTVGGADRTLVPDTVIRLDIGTDRTIGAQAGCNSMGGEVEITANRLIVGELAVTEMGCDAERHAQDEWLAGILGSGPAWSLDGDRLRLEADDTVIVLLDREVADPDRPLIGTTWRVDGLIDGDAVSSVPEGTAATLQFGDEELAITIEGCNQGSAPVTIGASTVTVDAPPTMTEIACAEPAATMEASVLEVLTGEIDYAIEAAGLTLQHPDGQGLLLRADEG